MKNKKHIRHPNKNCEICGAPMYAAPCQIKIGYGRFCSKKCKGVWMRGKTPSNATHKMTGTRTYKTWDAMRSRINNRNDKDYKSYGGRGIDIDPRWNNSFTDFFSDMGIRPPGKTLGRIDNSKGYWKHNCRWETPRQQNNNRRCSIYIEHKGIRKTIAQWARQLGASRQSIRYRLKAGWATEDILSNNFNKGLRRKQYGTKNS